MPNTNSSKVAVITGASSGIGKACAISLAKLGWQLFLGARRINELQKLSEEINATAIYLDVTDGDSVTQFCQQLPENLDLLINIAGGALGLEPISEARDEDWLTMYDSNVLGLMRMTRGLISRLIAGRGQIINMTSIAGREVYAGGGGYTAVKHAARAVTETLRIELNGTPVRVTDLAPGMVETNFSKIRFFGDKKRADSVYEGITPLTAEDIAECVNWIVGLPWHVNIDELVIKPVAQASVKLVARNVGL